MKDKKACFSHQSDDWATPTNIYKSYVKDMGFFDPCPLHSTFDGLSIVWPDKVFINPPYSKIRQWIDKAVEQINNKDNCRFVFLLPVRTDTKWFMRLYPYIRSIYFIKGRLHFNDSKAGAPFPSMIVECGTYLPFDYPCSYLIDA